MELIDNPQRPPRVLQTQPITDGIIVSKVARPQQATCAAAWPVGVSALALAVNACQRRDFQLHWLTRQVDNVASTMFCD